MEKSKGDRDEKSDDADQESPAGRATDDERGKIEPEELHDGGSSKHAGSVVRTYELFGKHKGRVVPLAEILQIRAGIKQLTPGAQVLVTDHASHGFGLGDERGLWEDLPRAGQTGQSYYIPPTPGQPPVPVASGEVATAYEIYGRLNGRKVLLWKELSFDGVAFHLKQGGRIMISHSPAEGYGFGGTPGSWSKLYGSRSPSDWGLDPDKGIVAFDGLRAYAIPATQLVEIFGSGWRQVVYA